MTPENAYDEAVARQEIPDPFAEERQSLAAVPAGERLGHESERLKDLEALEQKRRAELPGYKAALLRGDWKAVRAAAERVLAAAKSIAALLVLLAWPALAGAETLFPVDHQDDDSRKNAEFLYDQIARLRTDLGTRDTSLSNDAMLLNSTQTVGGAKVFTSSVAAGPQIQTSTAITSASSAIGTPSAVFVNGWTLVASTRTYAATQARLYGIQANRDYCLRWSYRAAAAGAPTITFNGEAASYEYASHGFRSDGSAVTNSGTSTECNFAASGGSVGSGQEARGEFCFRTSDKDASIVHGYGRLTYMDATPDLLSFQFGCRVDLTAAASSIQLTGGASGLTGFFYLWEATTALP